MASSCKTHLHNKIIDSICKVLVSHHRDTPNCAPVYIQMYPGIVVALEGASHFYQIKNCLDVDGMSHYFIQAQIIIDCGNKSMFI